jgi:hypothetical protein
VKKKPSVAAEAKRKVQDVLDTAQGSELDVLREFYEQFSDLLESWSMRIAELEKEVSE